MRQHKTQNNRTILMLTLLAVIVLIVLFVVARPMLKKQPSVPPVSSETENTPLTSGTDSSGAVVEKMIIPPTDIDYQKLFQDGTKVKALMESRKKQMGMNKSLDMIVHSDEQFKIGDKKISMSEILKKAFVKEGRVFNEKIAPSGEVQPSKINAYGIYVVQPGDNIWNIHFHMLKEYYEHKGVQLQPGADEPKSGGVSSGIGKILKFSENMVIIYNLNEKQLSSNIDLIEPLSKIVVYNMDEVFSLLNEISYNNIDRIEFDGKTIWLPGKKL